MWIDTDTRMLYLHYRGVCIVRGDCVDGLCFIVCGCGIACSWRAQYTQANTRTTQANSNNSNVWDIAVRVSDEAHHIPINPSKPTQHRSQTQTHRISQSLRHAGCRHGSALEAPAHAEQPISQHTPNISRQLHALEVHGMQGLGTAVKMNTLTPPAHAE